MTTQINDRTPVIIGQGQFQMDVPENLKTALGPIDITAKAIRAALEDTGSPNLEDKIDRVTAVRLFGDSGPVFPCPFGTSTNMPLSISNEVGIKPKTVIYSKIGGEQPQLHIAETAKALQSGESDFAIICGGEAIANMKAASRQRVSLDWSDNPIESPNLDFIDQGFEFSDLPIAPEEMRHSLVNAIMVYAMMETARRLRLGLSVEGYQREIGTLFAPFSEIAASNPFSMFKGGLSPEQICTSDEKNPMIASPYTKAMVAKDGVNQAAAIVMTTLGNAKKMGIPKERYIFLNGYAQGAEPLVCQRPHIDKFPVLDSVLEGALKAANLEQSDIEVADFYSCFPIVVFTATKVLSDTKIKTFTLTGGLPFFGGPGNNYSLHAIAEMIKALRGTDKYGLIHANGGVMTKHAVGVYSTHPSNFSEADIAQKTETKNIEPNPNGLGYMISYCLNYRKNEPMGATLLLRLESGSHALAKYKGDFKTLESLKQNQSFSIKNEAYNNVAELV